MTSEDPDEPVHAHSPIRAIAAKKNNKQTQIPFNGKNVRISKSTLNRYFYKDASTYPIRAVTTVRSISGLPLILDNIPILCSKFASFNFHSSKLIMFMFHDFPERKTYFAILTRVHIVNISIACYNPILSAYI